MDSASIDTEFFFCGFLDKIKLCPSQRRLKSGLILAWLRIYNYMLKEIYKDDYTRAYCARKRAPKSAQVRMLE